MATVTVPVHAPVIDWIVQNIHEDQIAPNVLECMEDRRKAAYIETIGSDEQEDAYSIRLFPFTDTT